MMKKINIYSAIIAIIYIIVIVCLVLFILYPAPIKPIIRTWIKSSNYPLAVGAEKHDNYVLYTEKVVQTTNSKTANDDNNKNEPITHQDELKLLEIEQSHQSALNTNKANINLTSSNFMTINDSSVSKKNLIVLFIGGSFLFQDLTSHYGIGNKLYELLRSDNFEIMLLKYPVRFSNTLQQSMLSINKTLQNVLLKYNDFYAIGYSAGALLASVFIQKELNLNYSKKIQVPQIGLNFKKLVGICGMYYPMFNNNILLTKLFRYYILRNISSPNLYTVTSDLEAIPKLIISYTTDFLYNQTTKFIQTIPNTAYKIYNNNLLKHTFIEYVDDTEAKDALELIKKFITQQVNHEKKSDS